MARQLAAFLVVLLAAAPALADRGRVVASIPAPGPRPTGLAFDGRALWVADHKVDRLVAVDPGTGAVLKSLVAPSWRTVGLAWDGRYLWTVDAGERAAYRVDPATGASDRRVELEAGSPRGLAWREGKLWVSDGSRLHEVDPEDGTTLRTVPSPSKAATGLAFAAGVLWVADRMDDAIYAVDPARGDVYFPVPSPGPYPFGLAEAGGDLLAVDYQDGRVSRLSLAADPASPWRRSSPKELAVEFTQTVRNLGPDTLASAEVLLAVPEPQPWQELLSQPAFDPAPVETVTEEGGQRLARFVVRDVPAGGAATIRMRLDVRLWDIQWEVLPGEAGDLDGVPRDTARLYTRDGSKLLTGHPAIRDAAAAIAARAPDLYGRVRETYRYVIDRMSYELTGGWNAAPMVLARGTGSCSEYTFLMLSLLRANRIPARYAGSFVVRGDDASWDEVYHRWVEVFLPRVGWVPVDANHGDKPSPREQAAGFGRLDNRVLVTTQSPGGTPGLGWTYDAVVRSTCAGKCTVKEDGVAEWRPLGR